MDFRRKTATVTALVIVACLVQAWMITRAVVPAQDSVRYLIVVQGFERDGFSPTLRNQPEQPLFPALVWLVHRALPNLGWSAADDWAISLQVAAAIPLVLSIVPVYLLFCRLHGERAALIAILIYCVLGGIARLGADGLSDSTHLALFMCALWCVASYFSVSHDYGERRCAWWLAAGGIFTGLALLARSESLVLPVALLATLGFVRKPREGRLSLRERAPFRRAKGDLRREWRAAAVGAATFVLGLAVILAPYLASCGAVTPIAALARLSGRGGAAEAAPLNDLGSSIHATAVEPRWELPGIGRLAFGKKDTSTSSRFRGYASAASKLVEELAQTLHYWLGALALVGLWSARRRLISPLDRFMQCLCAALVVAGVAVAAHAGYLSTRHVLLLVVLAIGWAGYGSLVVADWLTRFTNIRVPNALFVAFRSAKGRPFAERKATLARRRALATPTVAATVVLCCASDCLAPLHTSREAHRQAARWLIDHAPLSAAVLDSRGWTALYTGRKTYRYEAAQAAFCDPTLAYVVVEQAELETDSRRGETMRLLMGHAGEAVARFAAVESAKHSVVVYRWRPERFQQLGVQTYAR